MSDTPRDQQPDASTAGRDEPGRGIGGSTGDSGNEPVTGPPSGAPTGTARARGNEPHGGGLLGWLRSLGRDGGTAVGPETDPQRRRRRRWFVAGISAAAALVVLALCAGTVGVVSAVGGFRERAAGAREDRRLRESGCLDLEQRLNQLIPPGATSTPRARATAVRDENAAVRIYVNEIRDQPDQDGWRQLLDARTAYAEALELQAKSRTPAFYVAPRTPGGVAVTEQLLRWSPESCEGPIRRLAAPDL